MVFLNIYFMMIDVVSAQIRSESEEVLALDHCCSRTQIMEQKNDEKEEPTTPNT